MPGLLVGVVIINSISSKTVAAPIIIYSFRASNIVVNVAILPSIILGTLVDGVLSVPVVGLMNTPES